MQYDLLGRMTTRTEADLNSTWTYDACTKGVGKLCSASAGNDYQRTHAYDSLGRPSTLTVSVDTSYAATTTYDSAGRAETLTYPGGFATRNVYNSHGYLAEIRNNASNALIWQAQAMSASGRVTTALLGNGLTETRTYDVVDRLVSQSASGTGGTPQNNTYAYDAIGNLTQRADATQGVTEYFYYDSLNRLLASSGPGLVSRSYEYDAIGNMIYKSDVGTYTYGSKPHAVASVSGAVNATYTYDANGNLISGAGRTLAYASFNLPATVTQGTDSYQYTYDAEHMRVRLVATRASGTYTTIYVHPGGKNGALLYEKETFPDGKIEYRHYVADVGVYVTKSSYGAGDGPGMRYFHRDHLDSVQVITNEAGAQIERLAYEAYGKRRYPNGTADPSNALFGVTTERGFTGHEHLDEMQLVHMNGRIYDPVLGRFMTADPYLQDPQSLQSYNRYSYGFNNPLSGIDPSGYGFLDDVFDFVGDTVEAALDNPVKTVATIAVAYYTGQWIGDAFLTSAANAAAASSTLTASTTFATAGVALEAGTLTWAGWAAVGAGSGFAGALVATGGDFDAAFRSALAGSVSGGIAGYFGAEYPIERIGANAMGAGLSSVIRGGTFAAGFKNEFLWSSLTYANVQMREYQKALSVKDPINDGTGLSAGLFFDGFKLAGGRGGICESLGCAQSGGGRIFGIPYPPGSFADMVLESFAGPHDTGNMPWFYDRSTGGLRDLTRLQGFAGEALGNYTSSLLFAAPFAAGAIREQTYYRVYDRIRR